MVKYLDMEIVGEDQFKREILCDSMVQHEKHRK